MATSSIMGTTSLTYAQPMVNSTNTSGASAGEASTISANDFLTLLVTEMKNQDPTAQTDPNAYVNQLVQVNSLEQLIEINQNLTSALGTSNQGGTGSAPAAPDASGRAGSRISAPANALTANAGTSREARLFTGANLGATSGNLGFSAPNPAAQRVAQALGGHK